MDSDKPVALRLAFAVRDFVRSCHVSGDKAGDMRARMEEMMRWSCALLDGDAVEWHGHSEVMPAYYRDGKVCLVDDFGPELRMLRTDRVGVAELRTYEAVFYKENAVCASDGRKVSFYLER